MTTSYDVGRVVVRFGHLAPEEFRRGVRQVDNFLVGIFRVADPLDKAKADAQRHYFAIVNRPYDDHSLCYMSDSLFGLAKQMREHAVVKWDEAEKAVAINGYHTIPLP
jgi:hypothetical protein